ncbi:MAG TPA: Ig-like domain-containing protein, partial [Candidatus Eremiobacteraceae bacterium]|nr:Ig-like domain-containing protein [Candidatus Eremiobacteraceae bacterium]
NPQNPTIALGTTQQFTATGTYTDGSTQDLTTVASWNSSSATVAIISNAAGSNGLATSSGQGTATISATSNSISASTTITVNGPSLSSIAVTPASISVASGYGQQFVATATYSDGSTQDITQSSTWTSSVPAVASVNSSGLASGLMQGTTSISAAFGSMSASALLTVTGPLLVSINVSPGSGDITAGSSIQLTATATYSDGSTQNVTSSALWSSSPSTIATVSAGLLAGLAQGTTTVTAAEGQIISSGVSFQVASPTLTLTVTGGGAGSVSSADGEISNCSASGGICSATYNVGNTVTLTPSAIAGSTFNWSTGTGSAGVCSGSGACTFNIAGTATVTAIFTPFGGSAIPASPIFGLDLNTDTQFPSTLNQGSDRLWDTPGVEWPFVETANNTFNWTNVDTVLAAMASSSIHTAQVALARTPNFATSVPGDTSCNYYKANQTAPNYAAGQCDAPRDLNSDGTGANLYWRNWVGAYASHVAPSSGYTNTHAHVLYWETWNEPDTPGFWKGSYDQLIRMEQDLYCIVKGGSFTIRATGETCPQVWATVTSVTLTGPTDTTAYVLMPSYHVEQPELNEGQNFLYCNDSPATSCHTGGAAQTDVVNFHMKPGNLYPTSLESVMNTWISSLKGVLRSAELAKPIFNTEGGYAAAGWSSPYTDPNMQAAYIARFYIYSYSLGVSNDVWYYWNPSQNGLGSSNANTAYSQVYDWMVGSTFGGCTVSGTVYACTMTLANGVAAAAIWDNSQTCTPCTTTNLPVAPSYLSYLTLAGTKNAIVGNTVPVGIQPILVKAQ